MRMALFVFSMHTERCVLSGCVAVCVLQCMSQCLSWSVLQYADGSLRGLYAYGTVRAINVRCSVCGSAFCSVCCEVCCSMRMALFVFSMRMEQCELSACVAVCVLQCMLQCLLRSVLQYADDSLRVLYAYGTVRVISVCCSIRCSAFCSVCCEVRCSMQMALFVFSIWNGASYQRVLQCMLQYVLQGVFSMYTQRCMLLVRVAACVAVCMVVCVAVYVLYANGTVRVISVWCSVLCSVCCSACCSVCCGVCCSMRMPLFVFSMHMERCVLSACVAVHVAVHVAVYVEECVAVCSWLSSCSLCIYGRSVLLACVTVHVAECVAGCVLYAYGTERVISMCCSMCCSVC